MEREQFGHSVDSAIRKISLTKRQNKEAKIKELQKTEIRERAAELVP